MLKNGEGKQTPDIRCYELVYISQDFNGNIRESRAEPFYDRWCIWSCDTYSG
ncbi:MAG: hypothetical protein MJ071_07220 [Oscillospiraceae bacterium]|nr:hypothetical protein [Oscillospiraceae bacterium]